MHRLLVYFISAGACADIVYSLFQKTAAKAVNGYFVPKPQSFAEDTSADCTAIYNLCGPFY